MSRSAYSASEFSFAYLTVPCCRIYRRQLSGKPPFACVAYAVNGNRRRARRSLNGRVEPCVAIEIILRHACGGVVLADDAPAVFARLVQLLGRHGEQGSQVAFKLLGRCVGTSAAAEVCAACDLELIGRKDTEVALISRYDGRHACGHCFKRAARHGDKDIRHRGKAVDIRAPAREHNGASACELIRLYGGIGQALEVVARTDYDDIDIGAVADERRRYRAEMKGGGAAVMVYAADVHYLAVRRVEPELALDRAVIDIGREFFHVYSVYRDVDALCRDAVFAPEIVADILGYRESALAPSCYHAIDEIYLEVEMRGGHKAEGDLPAHP